MKKKYQVLIGNWLTQPSKEGWDELITQKGGDNYAL